MTLVNDTLPGFFRESQRRGEKHCPSVACARSLGFSQMNAGRGLPPICYLCLGELIGEVDRDHVPSRQIFPEQIRKKYSLNLLMLPVHKGCNRAFQKDEEYFRHSIGPLAHRTFAGASLMKDIVRDVSRPQGRALVEKVRNEFRWERSGVHLPPGLVDKRFEAPRVHGVVWKVVRGLFFYEKQTPLREHIPRAFEVFNEQ